MADVTTRLRYVLEGRGLQQAISEVKELDHHTGKSSASFLSLGNAAKVGIGATLVAAAGVAGGLAYAVNKAAEFEEVISGIGAVSNATADEMAQLSKLALQIGKDTAFTATESARAMEELVKAGISVEDILNGAALAAVNLAAAGSTNIPVAAAIMAGAMNAFNIAGKDAAHVADIITGAVNASMIGVEDFGIGFGQMAASANLVGFSLEDAATALALVTKQGIKASDAGTSLKTFFSQLSPLTAKAGKLMREFGIITEDGKNKFFDANEEVRSLAEVSQVLNDAFKGLSDKDRFEAIRQIFGSDAVRAAAILYEEAAEGVNKLKTEQVEAADAAEQARERLDNLKGSLEKMRGSIDTAAVSLGLALTPAIKVLVDEFTKWINDAVIPWVEKYGPDVAKWAIEMSRAFGVWLRDDLPGLIQGAKDLFGAIGTLVGWLIKVPDPVKVAGAAFIGLNMFGLVPLIATMARLTTAVLPALGAAILALGLPLLVIGGAIAGVAIIWALNWDEMSKVLDITINKWKDMLNGWVQWVRDRTADIFGVFGVQMNPSPQAPSNPQGPSGGEGPSEATESGVPFLPAPSEGPSEADEGFARGGIVTRPTRALIGERGPEAVIPLTGGNAMGGVTVSINMGGVTVTNEADENRLAAAIEQRLLDSLNRVLGSGTPWPFGLNQRA